MVLFAINCPRQSTHPMSKSSTPLTSTKDQLKNTEQLKTNLLKDPKVKNHISTNNQIKSFEDLVNVAKREKEAELKYDLERNVKLTPGKFNESTSFFESL